MTNSPKILEALRKAKEKLISMPDEEFQRLWAEHELNYVSDPVFEKWIAQAVYPERFIDEK